MRSTLRLSAAAIAILVTALRPVSAAEAASPALAPGTTQLPSACGKTWQAGNQWMCVLYDGASPVSPDRLKDPNVAAMAAAQPTYGGASNYAILHHGTYFVTSPNYAEFMSADIAWGYVSNNKVINVLGVVKMGVCWVGIGTASRTMSECGWITNTRAMTNLYVTGAFQNGAAGVPSGGGVIAQCTDAHWTNVPANSMVSTANPFCSKSDSRNWDHNMAMEFAWYTTGNGATSTDDWWCYVRSPVMHTQSIGGVYQLYRADWVAGANGDEFSEDHMVCGFQGQKSLP